MSILSAILQILQQPWPWFAISMVAFAIILVRVTDVVWNVSAWKTTTDMELKNLKEAIEKIPKEIELMGWSGIAGQGARDEK